MIIQKVIDALEAWAPPALAESYDNVGLLTGDKNAEITGILISLDCTESIVNEAITRKCNVIIAHHPIVFKGLKKITGSNYVERTIILAIKNDIAIYAIHTNLDNIFEGVNLKISNKIGLRNPKILSPKSSTMSNGEAFSIGSGMIGQLPEPMPVLDFLQSLKISMELPLIKHSLLCKDWIHTVAVCGGSGSFLIKDAIRAQADAFITADIKYHDFFDADYQITLLDIGHYHSEKFTIELIEKFLHSFMPPYIIQKTRLNTDPIQYFI